MTNTKNHRRKRNQNTYKNRAAQHITTKNIPFCGNWCVLSMPPKSVIGFALYIYFIPVQFGLVFFLFAFVLLAVNSHVSFAFRSFYWLAQWVAVHLQLFALDVYIYEGSAAQSKRAIEQCHQLPKWNNAHKNPNYNNLENMKSKTKRLGKCGMAKKVWWTVKMYLSKSH